MSSVEHVFIACVTSAHGLTNPSYRLGDHTRKALAKCTSSRIKLKPRVKLTLGDFSVVTRSVETDTGDATFIEMLLLPCVSDPAVNLDIAVEVYHSAGAQSVLRGDPLIGTGRFVLSRDAPASTHEVKITRGSSSKDSHGIICLSMTAATRERRQLILAKNSLLPGFFLKKHVATHWGIAVVDSSLHEKVYEIIIASAARSPPMGVLGPQGLIAHSVIKSEWNDWKQLVTSDRLKKGLLRPDDEARLEEGEEISDEEWSGMMRSRRLADFDSAQVHVGRSYRNDKEITSFILHWVQEHPKYSWEMNCQNFAAELFTFLTCGDTLDRWTIDGGIKAVFAPVPTILRSKDLLRKGAGMPSVAKVSQPLLEADLMPSEWRYDDLHRAAESNPLRWSAKPTIAELERDIEETAQCGRPILLQIRTNCAMEPMRVSCSDKAEAVTWLQLQRALLDKC